MPGHYCCVHNCSNKDTTHGVRVFKIPKNNFKVWAAKIPRKKGNPLRPGHTYYVCNAHFSSDCFMKCKQSKSAKVFLVSGSVPTIFNNGQTSSNSTKCDDYTIVEYELEEVVNIENISIPLDIAEIPPEKILNIEYLENIKMKNWSLHIRENEPKIILCYLNMDLINDRRLIIHGNLEYEVKIGFVDIKIENWASKLVTIDEFENLIKIIENFIVCPTSCTLTTAQTTKCIGYKTRSKNNYCSNCSDYYRLKRSNENKQKRNIEKRLRISENLNNKLQRTK